MSSRDSLGGTGDLIPQDVVEVLAQERLSKGSRRKKRSSSLGRAFGWLKGKRRKDGTVDGQSLGLGPGPDLSLDGHSVAPKAGKQSGRQAGRHAHPQGNSHAITKRGENENEKMVQPLFQENVFVEGSRPKYVEDLHIEAQEGLKMLQQEEGRNGIDYRDDESSISTVTVQQDEDGLMSDSTIPDTSSVVSAQSTASARSSRSGLTRQGSTFRPLNSGKKPEKTRRRRHRKTVVGIPQHVQRELGLDRVQWAIGQALNEEKLPNGDMVNMPSIDGSQQAAESHKAAGEGFPAIGVLKPLSEDHVKLFNSAQAGHQDDLALLNLGPQLSDSQRPHSLAVPWMTTADSVQQQPPSPVMSMSPQAPYMSKIIPNAILPPSIDVVEISRGHSRNSVRTVSKSSLLLSSPASSRASSRASGRASSSKASTISSASRYNPAVLSESSGWSHSESSETLVSDSSTISSNSTPRQGRSQDGDVEGSSKETKASAYSSVPLNSNKANSSTSNGKPRTRGKEVNQDGTFARSLSVMKHKKAPPPPSRSYSLHKMKRRSRDLAEVRLLAEQSPPKNIDASVDENKENKPATDKETESLPVNSEVPDSPGYSADTSSLDDSTSTVSFSPIKSQLQTQDKGESIKAEASDTKEPSPEKQGPPHENGLKVAVSPSSGYSSQGATPTLSSKQKHSPSPRQKKGLLAKLQSLFPSSSPPSSVPVISGPSLDKKQDLPESTKLQSPQHQLTPLDDTINGRPSVKLLRELFNIPRHPKIHAPPPPPPEVWAYSRKSCELLLGPPAPNDVYAIIRKNPKDRRQQRPSPSITKEGTAKGTGKVEEYEQLSQKKEKNVSLPQLTQSVDAKENGSGSEVLSGMSEQAVMTPEERLSAIQQETSKAATPNFVAELKGKMNTLSAISLARVTPSPPPSHHPPLPPTKQAHAVDTTNAPQAPGPTAPSIDSSWPAPPPPMKLSGQEKLDFPLLPPPVTVLTLSPPVDKPLGQVFQQSDSAPTPQQPRVEGANVYQQPPPASRISESSAQGILSPPQSIPPPPSYAAPPPPVQMVQPPSAEETTTPPAQKIILPPIYEVSLPPIKEVPSPPPHIFTSPLAQDNSAPPPQKVPPKPPQKVSLPPPPQEVFASNVEEFFPPPPQEFSSPPPQEVSPLPPPEVIPPPPPEVIPPPPPEVIPPPPPEVIPPPPPEVIPPPPPEVNPPPPPEVNPPPPPEAIPAPHHEVSPPPAQEVSSPPHQEIIPAPLQEAALSPPPQEVSPSPPQEVSPSPPQEVSPSPPQVVPPPPPQEVSPPPPQEVSPPPPQVVSPPPPQVVSPPPPQVVSPPPPQEVSPPAPQEVSPPAPQEVSPPAPQEVSPPAPQEVSPPAPQEVSPPPSQEVSPPHVSIIPQQEVTSLPVEDSVLPAKEVVIPSDSIFLPPQSIPPAPPQEPTPLQQENTISSTQDIKPSKTFPPPPDIIPPPPEASTTADSNLEPQNVLHPPPTEISLPTSVEAPLISQKEPEECPIPVYIPHPSRSLLEAIDMSCQPGSVMSENQNPEQKSQSEASALEEGAPPMVTSEPLSTVKVTSNISPENTNIQIPVQNDVIMRAQQPKKMPASGEAPQKPIRKSLIMTSPTSTTPPVTLTSPPVCINSQESTVIPTSSSTITSPTTKSPPAHATSPSMKLQEAIRLRTAARSKDAAPSRLSLQSPTSPQDFRKSPSSTASFIFSKSTKKVVIETTGAQTNVQKKVESTVSNSVKEAELLKKGPKVPPPVAKKPLSKTKEMEISVKTEHGQTAGQEALPESTEGITEKPNGNASIVQGEQSPQI